MIPKIIHRTARTNVLTWEENQLAKRAFRMMPGWQDMFWDDAGNRGLVEEHFPEYLEKYDSISRGVMKADIARLIYMHAFGGVYMDTDYKLLRPLTDDFLLKECVFGLERGKIDSSLNHSADVKIGNAFFAARKGHPFFKAMVDDIFAQHPFTDLSETKLMNISGPQGMTAFFLKNKEAYRDIVILPFGILFPHTRMAGIKADTVKGTIGVHLSWGSWRTKRLSSTIKNRSRRIVGAIL